MNRMRWEEKRRSPLPSWAQVRIEGPNDVARTVAEIERCGLGQAAQLTRFSIQKGRIVSPTIQQAWQHPRVLKMRFFIQRLLPLPDVEFLFTSHDLYEDPQLLACTHAPVFAISKTSQNAKVVLFPHVEWLFHWQRLKRKLQQQEMAWEQKKPVLFWRGATTGFTSRYPIVQLSRKYPEEIDALFSSFPQIDEAVQRRLMEENLVGQGVAEEAQAQFRYLLSLDGNCFGGSFFWQLASGSVVFKQDSDYQEWYYPGLSPYVHYIPFARNGAEKKKKKRWPETHEEECKGLVRSAIKFSEEILSVEAMMAYADYLLHQLI
ncbi:MAG: hypothetical protein HY069_04420 [Chlamydiia bacterium]|nr:hypothetical protein [Chlamydiia bacterium]